MSVFPSDPFSWLGLGFVLILFSLIAYKKRHRPPHLRPLPNEPVWARLARERRESEEAASRHLPKWARRTLVVAIGIWILGIYFYYDAFGHNPGQFDRVTGHIYPLN